MRGARLLLLLLAAAGTLATACDSYRIEHRRRPAYYSRLVDEPLPERETLPDGTVVVYHTVSPGGPALAEAGDGDAGEDARQFRVREEREDGTVVLRALLPEHVVGNLLNCLRLEEYDLIWDQLVSEHTKSVYAEEGRSAADFAAFCREHRIELARMLNRMRIGLSTHEVVVENVGDGYIVCRFWPQVAVLFPFKRVVLVREGVGLKLVGIR